MSSRSRAEEVSQEPVELIVVVSWRGQPAQRKITDQAWVALPRQSYRRTAMGGRRVLNVHRDGDAT
ncbi:MAG: hypothetical protein ACYDH5_04945 [Acidimicrobiales bacterium]